MEFKLKKPIRSLTGAAEITSVSMRDLVADDLVEGFAFHDKIAKQLHAMVCRCANILPEEVGKLGPRDYLALRQFVAAQLEDPSDPKEDTLSS